MKLLDLLYQISSRYRIVETFIRHPYQVLEQRGRRLLQDQLEQVELPINPASSKQLNGKLSSPDRSNGHAQTPMTESEPEQRSVDDSKSSATAVKPAPLFTSHSPATEKVIRGRCGRYRLMSEVVQASNSVAKQYNGVIVYNDKPILIKEYILSEQEYQSKKKAITLAHLNLRSSDGQDFRLITPRDVIISSDDDQWHCYLITEPISNSYTLREFLAQKRGPMTAMQVRGVLSQVLQTLWFIHSQRIPLQGGEIWRGLSHGNLSLDTLLIAMEPSQDRYSPHFLIYVTDLALWEQLVDPSIAQLPIAPTSSDFIQDLVATGRVAQQLLTGNIDNQGTLYNTQNSQTSQDSYLQQYIQKLLERGFRSAAEARGELLRLPLEESPALSDLPDSPDSQQKHLSSPNRRWPMLLLLGLAGGCLGGFLLGQHLLEKLAGGKENTKPPCCLSNIELPAKSVTYAVQPGIWSDALRSKSAVAYGKTLEQELHRRDRRLKQYASQLVSHPIAAVQAGRADFALAEWQPQLPSNFEQQEVAFDGLAVVVAYSNSKRDQSIPNALQGKISFDQLRSLYSNTGNWSPPGSLRGLPVRLYIPTDSTALSLFRQQVLQNNDFKPDVIAASSNKMFGQMLNNFETGQTIDFGFVRLSQVFEQCSVYPLAIGKPNQEVQPFIRADGQPINPEADLCKDKGSYWPNSTLFKESEGPFGQIRYPLVYRLAVIYPKNSKAGKQFAAALKTDEGQALLAATGLIPLNSLSQEMNNASNK